MSNPEVILPAMIEDLTGQVRNALRSGDTYGIQRWLGTLNFGTLDVIADILEESPRSELRTELLTQIARRVKLSEHNAVQDYEGGRIPVENALKSCLARGYRSLVSLMLSPELGIRISSKLFLESFCYSYGTVVIQILKSHTFDQYTLNDALARVISVTGLSHPYVVFRLPKVKALVEAGADVYQWELERALQQIPNQVDVHDYLREKLAEIPDA